LDSTDLLKNLDQLRRMQIDLALEHLALGSVPAERVSLLDMEQDEDSSRRYKRNAERFAKKEADVNSLMIRLEELSEAMRGFHFSMDEMRVTQVQAQAQPTAGGANTGAGGDRGRSTTNEPDSTQANAASPPLPPKVVGSQDAQGGRASSSSKAFVQKNGLR
ncbi:hypothetical protein HKX48_006397, partial [Thoreauomyces humboldtii]